MKFGPVALAQAEGAVLAHSVALKKGRLRKGRILTGADVAILRDAGLEEVIVARLGADDIGEDAAARQLAEAIVPDPANAAVHLTKAFTGRVNLLADGPGVAILDVPRLERINRVHPMITLATVPPFTQMADRGMLATIKMIAYGVPRAALEETCAEAAGTIWLARPRARSAALIVTRIAGGDDEKGQDAVAARLAAFGLALDRTVVVGHDEAVLARAISALDVELVLILTGSATSDIDDVAPAALRRAGGRVERFGMPVDPGNLLFLGSLGAARVIGLPGCARSPALNGADWVLSRILCDIPVTPEDIAGMGVGGLLKEIPTRPQPRDPR